MHKEMLHKVMCAVCGREDKILIGTGGRYSAGWHYFGKMNVNTMKTTKYLYKWMQDANGKLMTDSKGGMISKRIKNDEYDPKAKPMTAEYWECEKCYRESGKHGRGQKRRAPSGKS